MAAAVWSGRFAAAQQFSRQTRAALADISRIMINEPQVIFRKTTDAVAEAEEQMMKETH
jgi:hypothetical protein